MWHLWSNDHFINLDSIEIQLDLELDSIQFTYKFM